MIEFRSLATADLPLLYAWLCRPHVAQWWGQVGTRAEVEAEFGACIDGTDPVRCCIASSDGAPIGFTQWYSPVETHADGWWVDEHDPGVRGIDQFLADGDRLGRGIGTGMIRAFTDMLFADAGVTRIQTDPNPENARAIRCYEKAGFRAHGVVHTPDGPALLMYLQRHDRR